MKRILYKQPESQLFEFDFCVELMQAASGQGSDMPIDGQIDPFGSQLMDDLLGGTIIF